MPKCAVCKSELISESRKCSSCGEYQNVFRRRILHVGSFIGILTLIGTGLTFITNQSEILIKRLWPQQTIELIAFNNKGQITISNTGDGPVYVRDFRINAPFRSITQELALSIPADSIATKKNEKAGYDQFHDEIPVKDWPKLQIGISKCFDVVYFDPKNTIVSLLKDHSRKEMASYNASVEIDYYYVDTGTWLKHEADVVGLLTAKPAICEEIKNGTG